MFWGMFQIHLGLFLKRGGLFKNMVVFLKNVEVF